MLPRSSEEEEADEIMEWIEAVAKHPLNWEHVVVDHLYAMHKLRDETMEDYFSYLMESKG